MEASGLLGKDDRDGDYRGSATRETNTYLGTYSQGKFPKTEKSLNSPIEFRIRAVDHYHMDILITLLYIVIACLAMARMPC
jgi:hypothetical protein